MAGQQFDSQNGPFAPVAEGINGQPQGFIDPADGLVINNEFAVKSDGSGECLTYALPLFTPDES